MHPIGDSCTARYFIIDPYQIHYLRFILEAYEGIGVLSTIDRNMGLVEIDVAPGCEEEIELILRSEGKSMNLRPVDLNEVLRSGGDTGA